MANPMIDIDDRFSARASQIVALQASRCGVTVSYLTGENTCLHVADEAEARELRNRILKAIRDAEGQAPIPCSSSVLSNMSTEGKMAIPSRPTIDSGVKRINKIIRLLRDEFGADVLEQRSFRDDLWVALQAIYGADGANRFIASRNAALSES